MLQATVQQLGDASVVSCRGRIVLGEAYAILRDTAVRQGHVKLLVLDLAHVDRIDAGGLGVLLAVREWACANAVTFKIMNVMNRVERMLQLTALDRVFEVCSVQDLLCLLHRATVMASWPFGQSIHMATRKGSLPVSEKRTYLV
jgi:anti-anti-sigma factor